MEQGAISFGQTDQSGYNQGLASAAALVRVQLESNRSPKLLKLFDYLVEKTLEGEMPSEQQIANEVFAGDSIADGAQEPNVRVYVHRLRKMINSAYSEITGPRVEIPVGAYCIRLVEGAQGGDFGAASAGAGAISQALERFRASRVAQLVFAMLIMGILAVAWNSRDVEPLARTLAWQPFGGSTRPVTIVIGDYYLFADLGAEGRIGDAEPSLIWDRTVPTREDLTIFQMLNPAAAGKAVDFNQQFVSGGTIEALSKVREALKKVPALQRGEVRLVASSQLTPETLRDSDIIYVGQFGGMSTLLRDPLAQASGFRMGPAFDRLTDTGNGETYQSDGMVLTDERIARRDFAYIAGFEGPAGNRILVIAGLGEAGLKQAAELAGNSEQLTAIKSRARGQHEFEALYRVRTIKNVDVGATLVLDRALQSKGIWDNSGNVPVYRPIEAGETAPAPVLNGLPAGSKRNDRE